MIFELFHQHVKLAVRIKNIFDANVVKNLRKNKFPKDHIFFYYNQGDVKAEPEFNAKYSEELNEDSPRMYKGLMFKGLFGEL